MCLFFAPPPPPSPPPLSLTGTSRYLKSESRPTHPLGLPPHTSHPSPLSLSPSLPLPVSLLSLLACLVSLPRGRGPLARCVRAPPLALSLFPSSPPGSSLLSSCSLLSSRWPAPLSSPLAGRLLSPLLSLAENRVPLCAFVGHPRTHPPTHPPPCPLALRVPPLSTLSSLDSLPSSRCPPRVGVQLCACVRACVRVCVRWTRAAAVAVPGLVPRLPPSD